MLFDMEQKIKTLKACVLHSIYLLIKLLTLNYFLLLSGAPTIAFSVVIDKDLNFNIFEGDAIIQPSVVKYITIMQQIKSLNVANGLAAQVISSQARSEASIASLMKNTSQTTISPPAYLFFALK
ncbi:hypothetical protein TCAL_15476 [Tigriopus californicus]|uniref:Uncharacterized protein n=1 Tax=Tigriopus californicus TaxID=6832 RepID=A0A553PRJ9_TIGCA|nr:hypothetical protein TCAL_15476 [Tigriopus californicus]